jgi:hypothetical protein
MELISPVFSGRRIVFEFLASLEKAWTYCSATDKEAALTPFYTQNRKQVPLLEDLKTPIEQGGGTKLTFGTLTMLCTILPLKKNYFLHSWRPDVKYPIGYFSNYRRR